MSFCCHNNPKLKIMSEISVFEGVETQLKDVCRACLIKCDNMSSFWPKTSENSNTIAMLSSVGNFEIELNSELPTSICKTCEEKLKISYEFQQILQRTNELIKQCLAEVELLDGNSDQNNIDYESSESSSTNSDIDVLKPKQTMRLPQFSSVEVEKAIGQATQQFASSLACIKCKFLSSNLRALSIHMSHVHKESKGLWCAHCNAEYENLEEHSKNHCHEQLTCKFCDKVFTSKGHFKEHLLSHSNERPYKCRICDKGFISNRHLNKHLLIHASIKPFKCSTCNKTFTLESSLENHTKTHHPEENSNDREVMLPVKNYCEICMKRVRSLTSHNKEHHESLKSNNFTKDNVLCTDCGKQFKTGSKLKQHMRIHTGELPYKCSYCEKRMSSRNQLVVHERIHTGEKPHICNICGKAFAQSSVLNTHMKIHTGRPESCGICAKRFCRPAQLRLHMRKHTGEKPFNCTECDQSFIQRSHLSEHLKTHSDERPFKCNMCERGFKQNSSLKSHLKIHLGSKPFKCSQCHYACRQSYSLTQHMRQHSVDAPRDDKPHFCDLCSKSFSTMAMLSSHINLTHSNTRI